MKVSTISIRSVSSGTAERRESHMKLECVIALNADRKPMVIRMPCMYLDREAIASKSGLPQVLSPDDKRICGIYNGMIEWLETTRLPRISTTSPGFHRACKEPLRKRGRKVVGEGA